jgi:hypothetical protein
MLNGSLLVVGHPGHVRNGRRVDMGGVNLDGMVVLRVFVHVAVDTNRGRVAEADTTVLTRRTTHGSATARHAVRRVGTAEGSTTLGDERSRATANGERRVGVDILVLEINRVVILVVLVNAGGDIDSDRSRERLTTVIAGGTAHSSTALLGLPATLEGSTEARERRRVDILVLDINGVIILAVLVHIAVNRSSDRVAEANAIVIARGTTFGSAARDEGSVESVGTLESVRIVIPIGSVRAIIVTATGATHGSTADLRAPSLLPCACRDVVVLSGGVGSLTETSRRASKAGRRAVRRVRRSSGNEDGRRVNIGVLHLDRVVVLGILINGSLDIGGDRHIKALALVIARGTTHSSAAVVRVQAALGEGTLARSEDGAKRRRVNISVFDLDGVVVLAVLIHFGLGVDVGASVRADEASITIIARRSAHGSATDVWVVAASLHTLTVLL